MGLVYCTKKLECNPLFLDSVEERPRANAIVKIIAHILTEQQSGLVGQLKRKKKFYHDFHKTMQKISVLDVGEKPKIS